jgi:gamma-glutamyl-gamma-aminobutyrate hydrolase PuuD
MKRVLVSNSDSLIREMFRERGWKIANSIESCDLVVFSGGADINPFIYGERPLDVTRFSTARDNMEIGLWKTLPPKFPKVGICRGAQLGNVLCGGTLWQHVDNHGSRHPIKDLTGIAKPHLLVASSVHHQMCRLTSDAILFATANRATTKKSEHELLTYGRLTQSHNDWEDPEAFFYDNFNFMGVQFHPEYPGIDRCRDYFFKLLDLCFDFEDEEETPIETVHEVPTDERGIPVLG